MKDFISIEQALDEIRNGRMVILMDDEQRENEGDLVMAAEKVSPESINFMLKHARGLLHLTLAEEIIHHLHIPLMPEWNKHRNQAPFAISIEAAQGVTTGASVQDRAHTIQVAIDPQSTYQDITMPGHVFPLKASKGGVLERQGHTEGSVDLARLAGLRSAGILCEILREDGSMARLPDLREFAKTHDIKLVSMGDLVRYRLRHEEVVEEVAHSPLMLEHDADCVIKVYRDRYNFSEHIALIHGDINPDVPCLVRIHSECLTGDVFASQQCDCGWQLKKSLEEIRKTGGILLYLRQEGRGIGLTDKIRAYLLQSTHGLDTVEANHHLGFQADQRNYGVSAQILHALGVKQIRLLTNNPDKLLEMERSGIQVMERIALEMVPTKKNNHYLQTKRDKLGHLLTL